MTKREAKIRALDAITAFIDLATVAGEGELFAGLEGLKYPEREKVIHEMAQINHGLYDRLARLRGGART